MGKIFGSTRGLKQTCSSSVGVRVADHGIMAFLAKYTISVQWFPCNAYRCNIRSRGMARWNSLNDDRLDFAYRQYSPNNLP